MNTIQLTLQRYRRFHAKSVFTLQPGLTVVTGENGAGKSTLGQAMLHALFPAGSRPDPRSDSAEEPYYLQLKMCSLNTEMEITAQRGRYQVQIDGQQHVTGRTGTQRAAQAVTTEYLGLINQRAFEKVYFALQNDTAAFVGMKPKDRRELIEEVLQLRIVNLAVEDQSKNVRGQRDVVLQCLSAAAESASALRPLNLYQAAIKTFGQAISVNSKRTALANFNVEFAQAVTAQQKVTSDYRYTLGTLESDLRDCVEATKFKLSEVSAAERACETFVTAQKEKEEAHRSLAAAEAVVDTLRKSVEMLNVTVAAAQAAEPEAREYDAEAKRGQELQCQLDEHLQHKSLASAWAASQKHRMHLEQQMRTYDSLEQDTLTHLAKLKECELQAKGFETDPFIKDHATAKATLTVIATEKKALEQQQAHLNHNHMLLTCPTCGAPMTAAQQQQRQREISARLMQLALDISSSTHHIEKIEQQQRDWARQRAAILAALETARTTCGKDQQRQSTYSLLSEQLKAARQDEAAAIATCRDHGVTLPLDQNLEGRLRSQIKASARRLKVLEHARITFKQLDTRLEEHQAAMNRLEGAVRKQDTCQKEYSAVVYDLDAHQLAQANLSVAREAHSAAQLQEVKARTAADQGRQQWVQAQALERKLHEHKQNIDQSTQELARQERLAEHLVGFQGHFFSVNVRAVMLRASQLIANATKNSIRALELDPDAILYYWDQFKQRHDTKRLSGGEQALVGLCIRLALAERAQAIIRGSRVKFLILDEVLGSLDEDRRLAVQGILADILDHGAFEYIIMITHLDEVKLNWEAHRLEIHLDRTSGMSSVSVLESTWSA